MPNKDGTMSPGEMIVDRITDGMVDREPETIAYWIDEAISRERQRAETAERERESWKILAHSSNDRADRFLSLLRGLVEAWDENGTVTGSRGSDLSVRIKCPADIIPLLATISKARKELT